jgi:hypothetical protein
MTMEELLERISSRELVQWKALFELETEEQDSKKTQQAMLNSFL